MFKRWRCKIPFSALLHLPRVSLVPALFRELFAGQGVPREPEPDLVMNDQEAVAAFTEAGRPDGPAAAYYLFYSARASLAIQGAKRVLDIGTGPGTQLVQLAGLHPETHFTGVDLSEAMLEKARDHAAKLGVNNVEFRTADLTRLDFPNGGFDAVTGIMVLHHLPTEADLRQAFREIRRVLAPGGGLFLVDFGRLKSPLSMVALAHEKADQQHYLLTRDYERSLRAAFRKENYVSAAGEFFPEAEVVCTFKIPILLMVKTPDRKLPDPVLGRLREMAQRLDAAPRRDLDEIRVLFGLGGLANDPFEGGFALPWTALRKMALQETEGNFSRLRLGWRRVWAASLLMVRLGAQRLKNRLWTRLEGAVRRGKARADRRDLEALGKMLRKNLGVLKGPLMKFGQMAGYIDDRVPEEWRKLLWTLQERSPALPATSIRAIVEKSLGRQVEAAFAAWEDRPLASASIGQVHAAVLPGGQRVAVKVLFPGIADAVRSDLKVMGFLAPWLGRRLRVTNTRQLLTEVGDLILAECDFAKEAEQQERFRKAFAGDPTVLIPRVIQGLSTREVLTMEYVEGKSFASFAAEASAAERSRAGEIIARFAAGSLHRDGIFNGDPHPGNYLFLPDGRVAFLDFGFGRRWEPAFINLIKRQALAALENDLAAFAAACRDMGYESVSEDGYQELLKVLREGPYAPWLEDKPFRYTREFVRGELRAMSEFYRRHGPVRISPPHLIVHRVFWGHHALFADLGAEFNLHRFLVPLLKKPIPV